MSTSRVQSLQHRKPSCMPSVLGFSFRQDLENWKHAIHCLALALATSLHILKEKIVTHMDPSCLDTHADGTSFSVNTSAGRACEHFCVYKAKHLVPYNKKLVFFTIIRDKEKQLQS